MAAQEEKQFEKIWLFLHNCEYYDEVNIAIANEAADMTAIDDLPLWSVE